MAATEAKPPCHSHPTALLRPCPLLACSMSACRLLSKIFHWQPWLRHLYNHTVSAQDIAVLHRQVRLQ